MHKINWNQKGVCSVSPFTKNLQADDMQMLVKIFLFFKTHFVSKNPLQTITSSFKPQHIWWATVV